MDQLSAIDWTVCGAYLLVIVALAVWSARGQRDNEDYFVGGRRMNWFVVGLSLFATSFSSISFLGLPQRGAFQDFSFFITILGIPLVIAPILWWLFVPLYVRLRVSSGYGYLRTRFGPTVQRLGSLLYCGYALGWMGVMLYAIALTLQTVLGLTHTQFLWTLVGVGLFATAYTAVGGLKAVVWTDALQAATLGGAVVLVLLFAADRIDGGWATLWEVGKEHGKFALVHLDSPLWAATNFTEGNSLITAGAFTVFMYLPGYAVAQNMIQRYVCAGSITNGRRVIALSAAVNVVLGFLFLLVGVALYCFYVQPGGPELPVVGENGFASEDQILPFFVAKELPGIGIVGLLLAGLFAAAMSTIDSGINGVASVVVYDWLSGRQLPVIASRLLTCLLGALVIGAALLAPYLGKTVIDVIMTIAGTLLGALLAVFLLGMLVRRANAAGALIGLATGALCFASVSSLTSIPTWWYGLFTMLPTFVVGAAASLLFPPPPISALAGTVFGSQPGFDESDRQR